VNLNITSAVHLTRLVLPMMIERGGGRVLFTSLVAATAPGPYYATYAASKAFLYSFAVPDGPPDERFVYLSDVLPTAWQAVETVRRGGVLLTP
jgi:hypothetical protein